MDEKEFIIFDEESTYDLGGIQYRVTSHFDDNCEDIISKMLHLMKSDIENKTIANFMK